MADGAVLLTGASGLLGNWLVRSAPTEVALIGVVHRTPIHGLPTVSVDLRSGSSLAAAVADIQPSLIIHAAYQKDQTSVVTMTRHVAAAAQTVGADLLFISTDAVFDGDGQPRAEDAIPDPVWDYGRWKADAEGIASEATSAATVRLPLVVSVNPDDHVVRRIRAGSTRGEQTTWFNDEIRQPANAADLADALWRIALLRPKDRSGAWHLPGPQSLTRYEVAKRVVTALALEETSIVGVPTPPALGRPRHIHMSANRAKRCIGWAPTRVLI